MTELETVNTLLSVIGEAPINTLSSPLPPDAAIAQRTLTEVREAVLLEGWGWNTDTNVTLSQATDGTIPIPSNALRVEFDPYSVGSVDPVQRGSYVYDRAANTNVLPSVPKVSKLVLTLPWSDLPIAAQHYITTRAARLFASRVMPDRAIVGYSAQDELQARALLLSDEGRTRKSNFLNNPTSLSVLQRF